MENISIIANTILSFFGAVAIIGGGIKVIIPLFTPFKRINERLREHDERLSAHDKYLDNDNNALRELEKMARKSTQVDIALLNHFIEGNGIDKMKQLRDEIQNDAFNS